MTGQPEQGSSSRRTVKPFEIKARRREDRLEEGLVEHKHRRLQGRGSASPMPQNRRSPSPTQSGIPREESNESGPHEESASQEAPRPESSQNPDAGHKRFELECQLEVTNIVLKNVEKDVAEFGALRQAAEEQVEAAVAVLEASKERKSSFRRRLQAALASVEEALGGAKAAMGKAEAKIEASAQDADREAAALASKIKAAKDAAADACTRIGALEAENPELTPADAAEGANAATAELTQGEGGATPALAAKAAQEAAEGRQSAVQARIAELKQRRSQAFAALAAKGGKLGELGGQVVELEARLEALRGTASGLQARAKELGVEAEPELTGRPGKDMGTTIPARRPPRLFAVSTALPEVAGEYKLLPNDVSGRPAYTHKGPSGGAVHLFWSSAGGRCSWTFARELPAAAAPSSGEEGALPNAPLAASAQDAWTALPDELASSHWDAGGRVVDITLVSAGA